MKSKVEENSIRELLGKRQQVQTEKDYQHRRNTWVNTLIHICTFVSVPWITTTCDLYAYKHSHFHSSL